MLCYGKFHVTLEYELVSSLFMAVSTILDERTTRGTEIWAENLKLSYERKIWRISWEPPNNIGKYLS